MAKKESIVPDLRYIYSNRLICTVLEEMRECCKMLNFAPLPSLIEEAQILADRMESGLEQVKSLTELHEELHELKAVRRKLHAECKNLEARKNEE